MSGFKAWIPALVLPLVLLSPAVLPEAGAQISPVATPVDAAAPRPFVPGARLVRGDVGGDLGWLSVNRSEIDAFDDWFSRSFFGGLTAGWYWTDHWKTELSAGASTKVSAYGARPGPVGGPLFLSSRYNLNTRRLGLAQPCQFGRNAWFHPYAGVGLEAVAQGLWQTDDPVYVYDPVTRVSRQLRPEVHHPKRTDWRTFGSLSSGFKAYMTPRAFFRTDLRVTFADRPEEVLLRFGFGVDY